MPEIKLLALDVGGVITKEVPTTWYLIRKLVAERLGILDYDLWKLYRGKDFGFERNQLTGRELASIDHALYIDAGITKKDIVRIAETVELADDVKAVVEDMYRRRVILSLISNEPDIVTKRIAKRLGNKFKYVHGLPLIFNSNRFLGTVLAFGESRFKEVNEIRVPKALEKKRFIEEIREKEGLTYNEMAMVSDGYDETAYQLGIYGLVLNPIHGELEKYARGGEIKSLSELLDHPKFK